MTAKATTEDDARHEDEEAAALRRPRARRPERGTVRFVGGAIVVTGPNPVWPVLTDAERALAAID